MPDERFKWQSITPPRYTSSPMQATSNEGPFPFDDGSNEEVVITVQTQSDTVDVDDIPAHIPPSSGFLPGFPAPITTEHKAIWDDKAGSAESTGEATVATTNGPSVQGMMSEFLHFIDNSPLLFAVKEKVASYPIVAASTARRTNRATLKCDICQATFTRSHNLGCSFLSSPNIDCQLILPYADHKDSHFGIRKHSSVCGKKFGTPSGSKRHEITCPKCKEASG